MPRLKNALPMQEENRQYSLKRKSSLTARLVEVAVAVVAIFLFGLLTILVGELPHKGIIAYIQPVIRTFFMVCIAWVTLKFIDKTIVELYEERTGKPAPRLIIDLTKVLIIIFTTTLITIIIFGRKDSLVSILTAGGIITAGIAFALKEVILDVFAGFVIDIEAPFKKGDWIHVPSNEGKIEGEIVDRNWRSVYMITHDETLLVIPNGHFLKNGFYNLSRPQKGIWQTIEFMVGHSVPVERVERIVRSAILSIPEILDQKFKCYARKASEGGITYEIRYMISDYEEFRFFRHRVLQTISEQLYRYDLRFSDYLGRYDYVSEERPFKYHAPIDSFTVLSKTKILSVLTQTQLEQLIAHISPQFYRENEIIVHQGAEGQSMFIMAEGLAEVVLEKIIQEEKKEAVVATLGFGDFFGERSLLLGENRNATVRAKSTVFVYQIAKDHFLPFLKENPTIAEQLSELIVQRTHELQDISTIEDQKALDIPTLKKHVLAGIKKFFEL